MAILLILGGLDWLHKLEAGLHQDKLSPQEELMTRYVKRGGNIWIRIFPDKPITKKPLETRMGKGKGNVEYWVALVQPGKVLYEMSGVSEEVAREAFRLAGAKLPVKTVFREKEN